MGSLLMGDLASLTEIMSEGKSGSFFYFSHDMRFMVKTISMEVLDLGLGFRVRLRVRVRVRVCTVWFCTLCYAEP